MNVNQLNSTFFSILNRFNRKDKFSYYSGFTKKELIADQSVNMNNSMTQIHIDEILNVKEYLEKLINTKLNFNCVWIDELENHEVQFSDVDTNEVILKMTICQFTKMVDKFIVAKNHGQIMSSMGHFLSVIL